MREYHVNLSRAAQADLEGIADYIAIHLQEPAIAQKQMEKMKSAIVSLQAMPERHGLVSDKYLAAKGIRMLPVGHYLIFYTVNKAAKEVGIVRVLYGKRDWESLLQ